jgi:RNA polymerase sigma-70 factor (ECF subfamily)
MEDLDDLLRSGSQGHEPALEALLERFLPQLRAFARLHMGPLAQQESSADIVQSVCRQVLQDGGGFDYRGEAAFRKWLFAVCASRLRDHKKYWLRERRDARRRADLSESVVDHVGDFLTPSGVVMQREELSALERALDRMPEEYRTVVTLSKLVGLSHAEIGARIGKSDGATRMLLHRALARLGVELTADRD